MSLIIKILFILSIGYRFGGRTVVIDQSITSGIKLIKTEKTWDSIDN
jgi:hypothetical protein